MTALTVFAQGVGATSADQLNTFAQVTALATDLEKFIGITGMMVYVSGTNAAADGGQSWYYWNATATGPTSLPTVVVPTGAAAGAWVQLPPSSYTPPPIPGDTIMGNATGSPAAPAALTAGSATSILSPFVGDGTGAQALKGLVPAPASGDAALNKALKASGTWGRVGYIGVPVPTAPSLPYTIQDTDAGETLYFGATGTVTIPSGLTVGDVFDIGWSAGFVGTVTPGAGMTLINPVGGATGSRTVTGMGFVTVQILPGGVAAIRGAQNVT